jgi:uncharacterized membrane protein (UPF0127 family)
MKNVVTADRVILTIIVILFAVGVVARVSVDETKTSAHKTTTTTTVKEAKSTTSLSTTTTLDPKIAPFSTITFRIQGFGEDTGAKCALLADSQVAKETGMAGRSDLSGYDAMIFRFQEDAHDAFWGRGVPIALSVVWYDANGNYVDQNSIDPCPATATDCKQVGSDGKPFRYALEVPKGGFGGLHIRDGSTMTVGGPCSR